MAMLKGGPDKGYGTGGLILWPLFGATNQLLAGLAFMVTVFYLWRRGKPIWFAAIPMVVMLILPVWGLTWQMFHPEFGWWNKGDYLLLAIGGAVLALQIWMVAEGALIWRRAKGVLEPQLPPLKPEPAAAGGRSC